MMEESWIRASPAKRSIIFAMDVAILGASGDCGRAIAGQLVASRSALDDGTPATRRPARRRVGERAARTDVGPDRRLRRARPVHRRGVDARRNRRRPVGGQRRGDGPTASRPSQRLARGEPRRRQRAGFPRLRRSPRPGRAGDGNRHRGQQPRGTGRRLLSRRPSGANGSSASVRIRTRCGSGARSRRPSACAGSG